MATKKRVVEDDDEEMEAAVSKQKAVSKNDREAAGGEALPRVSTNGKEFTFGGEPVNPAAPEKMYAVVVDFVYFRSYYDTKYSKTNKAPPVCFSLSETGKKTVPHENSSKPQSKACATCPQNVPGSGGNSEYGRACTERRRLALIHVDDTKTAKLVKAAAMPMLEPSVMSLKHWGAYLKKLTSTVGKDYDEVLTLFRFVDGQQPIVKYSLKAELDEKIAAAVRERADEARAMLMTPFNTQGGTLEEDEDEAPKKKKKRVVEEDEDEDDEPAPRKKKAVKKVVDEDDEDEDDDSDDDEDEDEDETPVRKKKVVKKKVVDEDEDDEDEDDEDDEDDEPAPRKKKKAVKKKVVDEDDEGEDEDDEDSDDDEEDDSPPVKKRKSRFAK